MSGLRIGSLFTGTGALDLAVTDVHGGEVAWHSQYEPPDKHGREDTNQYAARILARHWPTTPNLGDITAIDWQAVLDEHGPVDALTGGFPCQDVSSAGQRAGLTPGTRSGLWAHMARAISVLRPRIVVIENVEGLLSAPAAGHVEPCPHCVGDPDAEPPLRALGAVLGDLARLGFDAEWCRVAASEVGAAHGRKRVFVYAWPAAPDSADLGHERHRTARRRGPGPEDSDLASADADRLRWRADILQLRPGQPDLDWGLYEPAIRRWEHILGRPAPWPTDIRGRLTPVFSEWLMGLPDGWVTCTPGPDGMTPAGLRNAMLRALGNGVVRQQAAAGIRHLHERSDLPAQLRDLERAA